MIAKIPVPAVHRRRHDAIRRTGKSWGLLLLPISRVTGVQRLMCTNVFAHVFRLVLDGGACWGLALRRRNDAVA